LRLIRFASRTAATRQKEPSQTLLIVSATDDKYSKDADVIAASCKEVFARAAAADALEHLRYSGGHALTHERFDAIVNWMGAQ